MGCIPSNIAPHQPIKPQPINTRKPGQLKRPSGIIKQPKSPIVIDDEAKLVSRESSSRSLLDIPGNNIYSNISPEQRKQLLKETTVKSCNYCRRSHFFVKIRMCERCRATYYCSHKCITADWTMHEKKCGFSHANKMLASAMKPAQERLMKLTDELNFELNKNETSDKDKLKLTGDYKVKIAECYYELSFFPKSGKLYQEALEIATDPEINDSNLEIRANGGLGRVSLFMCDFDKALKYCIRQLELALSLKDESLESIALIDLGMVYKSMGTSNKAVDCGKRALAKKVDTYSKIYTYNGLGIFLVSAGDVDSSKEYFLSALTLSIDTQNKVEEGRAYRALGTVERFLGNNDQAMELMEKALNISFSLGDRASEYAIYNNMGNVFKVQNKQFKAILTYQSALNISTELNDLSAQAATHNNFASLYLRINDVQQAIDSATTAIEIASNINDFPRLSEAYYNLACGHKFLNRISEAKESFSQAIKILSEKGCNPKLLKKAQHQIDRLDAPPTPTVGDEKDNGTPRRPSFLSMDS